MSEEAKWEGRSKGTKAGYKIFIWLLKTGGLSAAYKLLPFVTSYYRYFTPKAIKPLRYLYQNRLGYNKREANSLIRKNLNTFGQTILDRIAILSGIPTNLSKTQPGLEYIENIVKAGKGGIILSAHLGNWDMAGHFLQNTSEILSTTRLNVVMYDNEAEQLKDFLAQFNKKRAFNTILIKEDLSHIYEISAALNRNELICLHGDRYRPGNRTIKHPFLGVDADFPAGPFILASKLKAPVCFVFAVKETNFQYRFVSYPDTVYEGRGMAGANKMLAEYVSVLEKELKEYPSNWFNYYDFWK